MNPSLKSPASASASKWVYTTLAVIDGQRHLKPAQVAFDVVEFAEPPLLISQRIEIILKNGEEEQRHFAVVLPHDSAATKIPIQLLPPHRLR